MWDKIYNWICGACLKEKDILNFQLLSLKDVAEENAKENEQLRNRVEELKLKLEPDTSTAPSWLDPEKGNHKPSILILEKDKTYWAQIGLKDIYSPSASLEELVNQKKWRELPLNQKFMEIWKHVTNHLNYRYDQLESWEYPTTTHYRRYGDCEDGTIYFVTLCRLANVPADRVFNAVGKMSSIGHSWPIVKMEDDKWYIMESTLNYTTHPKPFKGSDYKAVWGVYNWKFSGGIDNVEKQV